MNDFWRKVELFFDKLIAPALILLLFYVIVDVFFTEFKYRHEPYFLFLDLTIISVFVGDLSFKFKRAANWKGFLKDEWLEILAIVPFFWIFRFIESVVRVGELAQEIIHLFARGGRLVRLFAAFGLTGTRSKRFADFIERVTRSRRFEEASKFFRHPNEK